MAKRFVLRVSFYIRKLLLFLFSFFLLFNFGFAQEQNKTISQNKNSLSFSQGTNFTTIAAENGYFSTLLTGKNLSGYNLDYAINYDRRINESDFLIMNLSYSYNHDSYKYLNHYLEEYGTTEMAINAHLVTFEIGFKKYSSKTKFNLYTKVAAGISFSLYRKNTFYIPGYNHYQEFTDFRYSHTQAYFGKGIDFKTYKNQYINLELGMNIPIMVYNYSNLIYSVDIYFKVGYGFTF